MTTGPIAAYMLHVSETPTALLGTLEQAKDAALPYIAAGKEVSVQNTYGRIEEWYWARDVEAWVHTMQSGTRP